ncbi:MAG: hypothetical protein E7123_08055 [Bacteroidales bacterium]|nr:hypothetical protein [Bacteroidales bacterium]
MIRKEGRRTVEETKTRVYVRFKDGRRLDVTVQTRLTVNPLWWDEKREEIKTKVIWPGGGALRGCRASVESS